MHYRFTHAFTRILALVLVVSGGRAVISAQGNEGDDLAVREMREDLQAFADGSWMGRLLGEHSGDSPARRVTQVREEICRGLDRHDETFRRLPVARQQAFLEELLPTLERFEPIPRSAKDSHRVVPPLESWRAGYRGYLMARYTRAWESRSETLLRFLKTLRLLPDGQNLFDGTLEARCLRYVYERHGSEGDEAVADAQLILLHEFDRFEAALAALDLDQRFDVWARWRLGLRSSASRVVAPPEQAAVSAEAIGFLREWSYMRAHITEDRLRQSLLARRELLLARLSPPEPMSLRLVSLLERIRPAEIDDEAQRWWWHRWGSRIGTAMPAGESMEELLGRVVSAEQRDSLREEYDRVRRAVRDRRWREVSIRATALSEEERAFLKRRLWIEELEKEGVK
ncbi:MAG: hypothetical protein RL885_14775 [Planctomycetota bacterium]